MPEDVVAEESVLRDWDADEGEKEIIREIIASNGFHPNDLLADEDGDGTSDLRAKAYSDLFEITDNILKPTYDEDHSGWPEDGYDWTDEQKLGVKKTDGNLTLYELMSQHIDEEKVKALFKKCVWLKVKGTEASFLEIGVEALKTNEFGGFSEEDITAIQQHICPDLGRIEPFAFNLKFDCIYLDPLNYRVIEVIERKQILGTSVKEFLDDGDHMRLVNDDLKSLVLESIKSKEGDSEKYKIHELVNSIQANGFSPEFPLAVIPVTEDFDIKSKEDLTNRLAEEKDIKFIVVDGNRRWTALNTINGYILGDVIYKSRPKTLQNLKKVVGSVPVIVKPARDAEDLKHIRLSTQTLHHHVGQEPWGPYAKARNVKASYDTSKGSQESRMEVMKAKWSMDPNEIKNSIRTLSLMDKSVEKGFLAEDNKSQKFGALKGVIGADRWGKWVGMKHPRLDTWIQDSASEDRIKATFAVFDSDGYAIRAGKHLNQSEFTKAIVSAVEKLDVLIAADNFTAEKIKQALTIAEAAALTLTLGADLDSFLPKIESYAMLTSDDKAELLSDASDTSIKFSRAHTRMSTMNEEIEKARIAYQQEQMGKIPIYMQEYIDALEDGSLDKIVIIGLLDKKESKELLIDPNFNLEESDAFNKSLHVYLKPLLATRPEVGDVPAEVAEVIEDSEE